MMADEDDVLAPIYRQGVVSLLVAVAGIAAGAVLALIARDNNLPSSLSGTLPSSWQVAISLSRQT